MKLQKILSPREWLVEEPAISFEKSNFYETIFTVGNGYQGTRGTLEEGIKEELPFFIYTQPETARALEMYWYNTMSGALENAGRNNLKGSQFAWESADTGHETTPKWTSV